MKFGLFGKIKAQPGKRAELAAILLEAAAAMPTTKGCRHYVVYNDAADADTICVSEIWDSKEDHAASLQLPGTPEMIARARPLIAGFSDRAEMEVLGGHIGG